MSDDLTEELNRHDLAMLLDRAMNYLSATTRKALEMHYFAGLPQSEVVLQLGMIINSLEVKLHTLLLHCHTLQLLAVFQN